jgi:hypothetical protein
MSLLVDFSVQTEGIQSTQQMAILLIGQFHHLNADALIYKAVLLGESELGKLVGKGERLFRRQIFGLVQEVGVPGTVH